MGEIVVIYSITLDGVMQSPGRPKEDTRGGFSHGGWAERYVDGRALEAIYRRVGEAGGLRLLPGRRGYEDMLGVTGDLTVFAEGSPPASLGLVESTPHGMIVARYRRRRDDPA